MGTRLTMPVREVGQLLDRDLTIRVADEKGTDREHLLFYSERDHLCFVAIRDAITKTVVTVLPVDYYETLGSRIHWKQLDAAREMVETGQPPRVWQPPPLAKMRRVSTPPVGFRIAVLIDVDQGRRRVLGLGSWPAPPSCTAETLMADPRFIEKMRTRILAKVDSARVHAILFERGKTGPIVSFDATELNNTEFGTRLVRCAGERHRVT